MTYCPFRFKGRCDNTYTKVFMCDSLRPLYCEWMYLPTVVGIVVAVCLIAAGLFIVWPPMNVTYSPSIERSYEVVNGQTIETNTRLPESYGARPEKYLINTLDGSREPLPELHGPPAPLYVLNTLIPNPNLKIEMEWEPDPIPRHRINIGSLYITNEVTESE